MKLARILGNVWKSFLFPFVVTRTSATLVHPAGGEDQIRLVTSRCGRDRRGAELAYEIDRAAITLHGERSTYDGSRFELAGEDTPLNPSKAGEIRVDRSRHKLEIRVMVAGKPWRFNGDFPYDEAPA